MKKFKLSFRNKSAREKIIICEQVVTNVAQLPPEKRIYIKAAELNEIVACARASYERGLSLRSELRSELSTGRTTLAAACKAATEAALGIKIGVGHDPVEMMKAGLVLEKEKAPIGKPDAPGNLRAEPHGDNGVRLRWIRPVRRCAFQIEYALDPLNDEVKWTMTDTTFRQSCIIPDLESGKKYWFRVRASNAHGAGPWSNLGSARVR